MPKESKPSEPSESYSIFSEKICSLEAEIAKIQKILDENMHEFYKLVVETRELTDKEKAFMNQMHGLISQRDKLSQEISKNEHLRSNADRILKDAKGTVQ